MTNSMQSRYLLAVAITIATSTSSFAAKKVFYVNRVNPNAQISGGALVRTWSSNDDTVVKDDVVIEQVAAPGTDIKKSFRHANVRTQIGAINGATRADVIRPTGSTAANGWTPASISVDDGHQNPNKAQAGIEVKKRNAVAKTLPYKSVPRATTTFTDYSEVTLQYSSSTGYPKDGHEAHSADAWSAAKIVGATRLPAQIEEDARGNQVIGNTASAGIMAGGEVGHDKAGKKLYEANRDPISLDLIDMTDPDHPVVVAAPEIMTMDLFSNSGAYDLSENGILLAVDTSDPDAVVALDFAFNPDWVVDPYVYGAKLTVDGLTTYGETAQSGWQMGSTIDPETGASLTTAYYDFAANQSTFLDTAEIRAPKGMLQFGRTYQVDYTSGHGETAIAANVPATLVWTSTITGDDSWGAMDDEYLMTNWYIESGEQSMFHPNESTRVVISDAADSYVARNRSVGVLEVDSASQLTIESGKSLHVLDSAFVLNESALNLEMDAQLIVDNELHVDTSAIQLTLGPNDLERSKIEAGSVYFDGWLNLAATGEPLAAGDYEYVIVNTLDGFNGDVFSEQEGTMIGSGKVLQSLEIGINQLIASIWQAPVGDANLDGAFDSQDLIEVFARGAYETELPEAIADWTDGDWNGDNRFTSNDLVLAFSSGEYSTSASHAAVPEPAATLPAMIGFGLLLTRRRR